MANNMKQMKLSKDDTKIFAELAGRVGDVIGDQKDDIVTVFSDRVKALISEEPIDDNDFRKYKMMCRWLEKLYPNYKIFASITRQYDGFVLWVDCIIKDDAVEMPLL